MSDPDAEPMVVEIRDDGIRLGQFLKLANLIDSGSDVKPLLASGAVSVNGRIEVRRGRQLVRGDLVALGSMTYQVGDPSPM